MLFAGKFTCPYIRRAVLVVHQLEAFFKSTVCPLPVNLTGRGSTEPGTIQLAKDSCRGYALAQVAIKKSDRILFAGLMSESLYGAQRHMPGN